MAVAHQTLLIFCDLMIAINIICIKPFVTVIYKILLLISCGFADIITDESLICHFSFHLAQSGDRKCDFVTSCHMIHYIGLQFQAELSRYYRLV